MGLFDLFKRKSIFDRQPSHKLDPTANTWEAKRMRDAMTDARDLDIKDAHSWNPETHPKGEGSSYLVNNIHYDPGTKKLTVTYRDGFTAVYDNISLETAKEFIVADSKGRFARKHLFHLPYTKG